MCFDRKWVCWKAIIWVQSWKLASLNFKVCITDCQSLLLSCLSLNVHKPLERRSTQPVAAQVLHACGEREGRRVDSGRGGVLQAAPPAVRAGRRHSAGLRSAGSGVRHRHRDTHPAGLDLLQTKFHTYLVMPTWRWCVGKIRFVTAVRNTQIPTTVDNANPIWCNPNRFACMMPKMGS